MGGVSFSEVSSVYALAERQDGEVDDKAEIKAEIKHIFSIFRKLLEAKNTCLASIQDEVDEVVDFCRKYLYVLEDYRLLRTTGRCDTNCTLYLVQTIGIIFSCSVNFSSAYLTPCNSTLERALSMMKVLKTY